MGDCIKKATATSVEVQWLNVSEYRYSLSISSVGSYNTI